MTSSTPYGPDPSLVPQPVQHVQPRTLSMTSFILGLVSFLVGWTLAVPVVALVLGILALKKEPAAKGFAIAGIVLSAFNFILGAAILVVLVTFLYSFGWLFGLFLV